MNINRRNAMRGTLAVMALSALMLSGCGKSGGDVFLGKWEDQTTHATVMDIERNGDGYLIKTTTTKQSGQKNTGSVPAVLKDGVLTFQNGPVTGTMTYVKKDDSLLASTFAGTFPFARLK